MNILILEEFVTGNDVAVLYRLTILVPSYLWLGLTWRGGNKNILIALSIFTKEHRKAGNGRG